MPHRSRQDDREEVAAILRLVEDVHERIHRVIEALSEIDSSRVPAKHDNNWLDEIRERHPHAYEPWEDSEDLLLGELFQQGQSIEQMSDIHGRGRGAIVSRLLRLGLVPVADSERPPPIDSPEGDDDEANGVPEESQKGAAAVDAALMRRSLLDAKDQKQHTIDALKGSAGDVDIDGRWLTDRLSSEIWEIDLALERLDNGGFGLCLVCGIAIGARLNAVPWASFCIDHQGDHEKADRFLRSTAGRPCPEPDCGGLLIQRGSVGRGAFWGCSRYPKCHHTERIDVQ